MLCHAPKACGQLNTAAARGCSLTLSDGVEVVGRCGVSVEVLVKHAVAKVVVNAGCSNLLSQLSQTNIVLIPG